jgi:hypothetical protein
LLNPGRYPTRFGFEFTPVTKLLARMLAMPKKNAIHSPIFHEDRVKYVPPMTHMVVPRFVVGYSLLYLMLCVVIVVWILIL